MPSIAPIVHEVVGNDHEETERDRSSPSPKGRSQNRERTATLLATKRSGRRRGNMTKVSELLINVVI